VAIISLSQQVSLFMACPLNSCGEYWWTKTIRKAWFLTRNLHWYFR
jgi:hypothetical protein